MGYTFLLSLPITFLLIRAAGFDPYSYSAKIFDLLWLVPNYFIISQFQGEIYYGIYFFLPLIAIEITLLLAIFYWLLQWFAQQSQFLQKRWTSPAYIIFYLSLAILIMIVLTSTRRNALERCFTEGNTAFEECINNSFSGILKNLKQSSKNVNSYEPHPALEKINRYCDISAPSQKEGISLKYPDGTLYPREFTKKDACILLSYPQLIVWTNPHDQWEALKAVCSFTSQSDDCMTFHLIRQNLSASYCGSSVIDEVIREYCFKTLCEKSKNSPGYKDESYCQAFLKPTPVAPKLPKGSVVYPDGIDLKNMEASRKIEY